MSLFLRPPGAAPEREFRARCISCGQCAQICNYACIVMRRDFFWSGETPRVYPYSSPCFLCMKCPEICPSGALRPVEMSRAGMGLAYINTEACVSYQARSGLICWTCYERCPLKFRAIYLRQGLTATIRPEECAGCGVCAYVCPIGAISMAPSDQPGGRAR